MIGKWIASVGWALGFALAAVPASAGELAVTVRGRVALERAAGLGPASPARGALRVPGFDPALGTLVGVRVEARAVLAGSAGLENLGPLPAVAQSQVWGLLAVERADGLALGAAYFESQHIVALAEADQVIDFAGPAGAAHALAGQVQGDATVAADARWLAAPQHPDDGVALELALDAFHEAAGASPLVTALALSAEVELTVVYLYR